MFRLKSFAEKVQPIEESLTKPQVKEVFSNNDFKIGLEFEFYNQDFLEKNGLPTSEMIFLIAKFKDAMTNTQKENKKTIILRYAKTKNKDLPLDTEEHLMDKFDKKEQEQIYFYFHQQKIKRKELNDLIYYYMFAFTQKQPNLEQIKFFKTTEYYRKEVLEKFKPETPIVKKFIHLLENAENPPKFEQIRKFYQQNENLPKCIGTPIVSTSKSKASSTKWIVKEDPSVHPALGGIEIVSPPMKVNEAISATKEVFDYINKHGNTNTNQNETGDQCGLHINISFSPERMKHFDPIKFVLFSNEAQMSNEKLFTDRKHSQHIDNLTRRMKKKFESLSNATNRKELFDKLIQENMKKGFETLDTMLMGYGGAAPADKGGSVNLKHYSSHKRIVRRKNERVEVRFFGGQDYHKKFDTFKRVLSELLYAFDVATDPEKEKQKYQKKVFRLVNTINKSKDK